MRVEVTQIVRAPREKVYAAYTDFESMPNWSKGVTAVRVVRMGEGGVRLETETLSGGVTRKSTAELTLSPASVESERETRFTRTRRSVTFEDVPEGTKVTAVVDVRVKGLWSVLLTPRGREEAESSAREGLASFANYVENLA